MTPEEAEQIIAWLEKNPTIQAELVPTVDENEMELRLSRKTLKGQTEYVIIGIPMLQRNNKRLT